ncbi:MAG: hypothetical protein HOB18_08890 [Nitrospina sp.]|nr:hypothetical protein [Nitrospina sp.]
MANKFGVIIGKVFLYLFALVVAMVISAIVNEILFDQRLTDPTLTFLFLGTLCFPIWYHSKISFRLIAVIVGPIAGFLFWSISRIIPVEAGSGMILVAGLFNGGAFVIGMLMQLFIMRQGRVSSVAGTTTFKTKDALSSESMDNDGTASEETSTVDAEPIKMTQQKTRKIKIIIWALGLFICSFVWAQVMATAMGLHQPSGTINRIGVALGMSLPVFTISGAFAGIAYFIKRRPTFAMWVWTFSLLFSFVVLGIGAAKVAGS